MKIINKYFLIIVLLCLIAVLGFAVGPDTVVYITKTGKKYHTEQCSSLRASKIEIMLGEAVSKGYEPCQICKPPVLEGEE